MLQEQEDDLAQEYDNLPVHCGTRFVPELFSFSIRSSQGRWVVGVHVARARRTIDLAMRAPG